MKMKKIITQILCGATLAVVPCAPLFALSDVAIAASRSVSPADSSGFVMLAEAVPDAILEVRYYSTYNFVGDRIDGYREPCAILTREAAAALKAVSDDVKKKGYRLKIFDAYRPQMAVTNFVKWAEKLDDKRMKPYFYPQVKKDVLFDEGYIAAKSGHSRGSTVDLTLFDMATGKEVDMGGTFDHFGIESHPDWCGNPDTGKYTGEYAGNTPPADGKINATQFKNRMILRQAMLRHGFKPLDTEWWHFTLANEPYPDTYFTFPVQKISNDAVDAVQTAAESPAWVAALPAAKNARQLFVVAGHEKTTAWVSMHEKSADGTWREIMTTPGFIGKNGLGKTREGDNMTPVGTFRFNRAFGLNPDPGCAIPYVQADENTYWSGDVAPGMKYNQLVQLKDLPNLNKESSERIADYPMRYRYCLNISYNEKGTPGLGSAIFLHCFGPNKPFSGGCVAIPEDKMKFVVQHVRPDCVVVIDSMQNLGAKF